MSKKRKFNNFDAAKYRVKLAASYLGIQLTPNITDQIANELSELKNDNIEKDNDKFVINTVKDFIRKSELDSLHASEYEMSTFPLYYDDASFDSYKSTPDIMWNTYYNFMIAITVDDWRVELRQDNVRYNGFTTNKEAVLKDIEDNNIVHYIELIQKELKKRNEQILKLNKGK